MNPTDTQTQQVDTKGPTDSTKPNSGQVRGLMNDSSKPAYDPIDVLLRLSKIEMIPNQEYLDNIENQIFEAFGALGYTVAQVSSVEYFASPSSVPQSKVFWADSPINLAKEFLRHRDV